VIHREQAERQLLRLSVLPCTGQLEAKSDEIANGLKLGSRNLEHADRIVTEALKPREWRCWTAAELAGSQSFQLLAWSSANRKSVQRISRQQYEQLQPKVSGVIGQQLISEATEYCHCAVGRKRVEAIAADALEEAAKAAKSSSSGKRQRTM
jgi:hypothetical protein